MSYQSILYEVKEGVGLITLNRPDRLNAWNHEIETELREVMSEASIDGDVKAVVITGAGRGFCAGADMSDLSDSTGEDSDSMRESQRARLQHTPMEGQLELPSDYSMRYTYFTGTPKPVIAAINGPCAGLGLVMSLFCDVRFASDKAVTVVKHNYKRFKSTNGYKFWAKDKTDAMDYCNLMDWVLGGLDEKKENV